jgi:hypothetical protein
MPFCDIRLRLGDNATRASGEGKAKISTGFNLRAHLEDLLFFLFFLRAICHFICSYEERRRTVALSKSTAAASLLFVVMAVLKNHYPGAVTLWLLQDSGFQLIAGQKLATGMSHKVDYWLKNSTMATGEDYSADQATTPIGQTRYWCQILLEICQRNFLFYPIFHPNFEELTFRLCSDRPL